MFDIDNYKNIIETIIPFHKVLGLQLIDMKEGYASIRIPFKKELVGDPRTNRIHGGVISTAMDAAGVPPSKALLTRSLPSICWWITSTPAGLKKLWWKAGL